MVYCSRQTSRNYFEWQLLEFQIYIPTIGTLFLHLCLCLEHRNSFTASEVGTPIEAINEHYQVTISSATDIQDNIFNGRKTQVILLYYSTLKHKQCCNCSHRFQKTKRQPPVPPPIHRRARTYFYLFKLYFVEFYSFFYAGCSVS